MTRKKKIALTVVAYYSLDFFAFTLFKKFYEDKLEQQRIEHDAKLSAAHSKSFTDGYEAAKDQYGRHPHIYCADCRP